MREIKFRAWDTAQKMMVGVTDMEFYDGKLGWINTASFDDETKNQNDGDPSYLIPMQYTGLHDSNGKEIYEDDIVKNEYGKVMDIQYDPRSAAFGVGDYYFGTIGSGKILEVIGNIFEDKQLLEGKQ